MRRSLRFATVCLLIAPCACDLNPQPEPPFSDPNGGMTANAGSSSGGQGGQAEQVGGESNSGGEVPNVPVDSRDQDAGAAGDGDGDGDGDTDSDAGPPPDAATPTDGGG